VFRRCLEKVGPSPCRLGTLRPAGRPVKGARGCGACVAGRYRREMCGGEDSTPGATGCGGHLCNRVRSQGRVRKSSNPQGVGIARELQLVRRGVVELLSHEASIYGAASLRNVCPKRFKTHTSSREWTFGPSG